MNPGTTTHPFGDPHAPADRPIAPGHFSVIMTAYQAEHCITEALESAAAQTLLPAEVLIFEDGRTDDVVERIRAFASHSPFPLRVFGQSERQGDARARNYLLAQARANYLAFLDPRDAWEPSHLKNAACLLGSGAEVCFSGSRSPGHPGEPTGPSAAMLRAPAHAIFRGHLIPTPSAVCLHRRVIDRAGWFDVELAGGADLDLWLRQLQAGARLHFTGDITCQRRLVGPVDEDADLTAFYTKHLDNPLLPSGESMRALIEDRRTHARRHSRRDPATSLVALQHLRRLQPWNPRYLLSWLITEVRARLNSYALAR